MAAKRSDSRRAIDPRVRPRTRVPVLDARQLLRDRAVPIAVRIHNQSDVHRHRHGFTELVIVLDGSGDHLLDESPFPIAAGDVFVVDENHVHGYRNARNLRIANVLFDEAFVLGREPSLAHLGGYQALVHLEPAARKRLEFEGKLRMTPDAMALVESTLYELESELREASDGHAALALALLVQLLVRICRLYASSDSRTHRGLADIGTVVSHLERRYAEEVSVADLGALVAMSERTLMRRFSEATGTTPLQYLLRVRVSRAAHLLRSTRLPVSEIASRVGFSDGNYLSRQFRRITGSSPLRYRQVTATGVR